MGPQESLNTSDQRADSHHCAQFSDMRLGGLALRSFGAGFPTTLRENREQVQQILTRFLTDILSVPDSPKVPKVQEHAALDFGDQRTTT